MTQSVTHTGVPRGFVITDYGAVPDDSTNNGEAIAACLRAAGSAGGGTVVVPPGVFRTGPILVQSNIDLYLEPGSVLSFMDDPSLYPPVLTRWEGVNSMAMMPALFVNEAENVSIRGRGTLEGNGASWWRRLKEKRHASAGPETDAERALAAANPEIARTDSGGGGRESGFLRPPLLQARKCRKLVIEGITVRNSPMWTVHLLYCDDVVVRDVTVYAPDDSPNTDALDIDSSRNVRVSDCTFDVGDDCIVLKSGIGEDGRKTGIPTEEVAITNCTMMRGHGGIVLGSETAGGIRNVVISNSIFKGTDRGIRLKTRRGRSGFIENLRVSNVLMENVLSAIIVNMMYRCGTTDDDAHLFSDDPCEIDALTPRIRNVVIDGVTVVNASSAAVFVYGLAEQPVENLVIRGLSVINDSPAGGESGTPSPANPAMTFQPVRDVGRGIWMRNAVGVDIDGVTIIGAGASDQILDNVQRVTAAIAPDGPEA